MLTAPRIRHGKPSRLRPATHHAYLSDGPMAGVLKDISSSPDRTWLIVGWWYDTRRFTYVRRGDGVWVYRGESEEKVA